jgi:hypothetical protein
MCFFRFFVGWDKAPLKQLKQRLILWPKRPRISVLPPNPPFLGKHIALNNDFSMIEFPWLNALPRNKLAAKA